MKKCLVLLEFGKPLEWTQKFIDRVQGLGEYDWYFQLYTPNGYESKGNVQIIPMNIDGFNEIVESKLGINPKMFITPDGIPSFHITDFHVMLGKIFEDCLKGFHFWGTIGNDTVVGRLDHFVTNLELDHCDVWNDDIGQFNAHFCLWRNNEEINNLFKKVVNWKEAVTQSPCPGCLGTGEHRLYLTDESGMTQVMKATPEIRWGFPKYYLIHSHDRLENHKPDPKLTIKDDGSLWELLADTGNWGGRRHPFFGREIAYFHFSDTKTWPTIS